MSEDWTVDPAERVRELGLEFAIGPQDNFTYSWSGGYERLDLERAGGGGLHYQGVFHPGDGCCQGNPCRYCGMVWHE